MHRTYNATTTNQQTRVNPGKQTNGRKRKRADERPCANSAPAVLQIATFSARCARYLEAFVLRVSRDELPYAANGHVEVTPGVSVDAD